MIRRRTTAETSSTTVDLSASSRFDQWSTQDIYTALESQVMDLQRNLDDYHRSDPSMVLAVMEMKLATAMEALRALRRRLSVANDKRNG